MKANLSSSVAKRLPAREKLAWTISIEPTQIDFMDDDSVFVAGSASSGSDCSAISPLPKPRVKNVPIAKKA